MIDWSKIVSLTEQKRQEGLKEQNFSDLALFTKIQPNEAFSEGYKRYSNSADVFKDFKVEDSEEDSLPIKMARIVFSQTPNIKAGSGSLIVIPMQDGESKKNKIIDMQSKVNFFGIMFDELADENNLSDLTKTVQDMEKVLFVVSKEESVFKVGADENEPDGAFVQVKDAGSSKTRCLFYSGDAAYNAAIAKAKADAIAEAKADAKADVIKNSKNQAKATAIVNAKADIDKAKAEAINAAIEEFAEDANKDNIGEIITKATPAIIDEIVNATAEVNIDKVIDTAVTDTIKELEKEDIDATTITAIKTAIKANVDVAEITDAIAVAVAKAETSSATVAAIAAAVAEVDADAANIAAAAAADADTIAAAGIAATNAALEFMAAYASRGLATNFNAYSSASTMQLKTLTGILPDDTINNDKYDKLMTAGVDCYPSFGIAKVATSGANKFFDVVVYEMAIKSTYITSLFNSLATTPTKIAQTNAGLAQIKANAIRDLKKFQNCGVLASGVNWSGEISIPVSDDIFQLGIFQNGMYLWFDDINNQPQALREERKTPAGYLAIKFAGAFHGIESTISFEN